MAERASEILEKLYTHFILRDFVYVFGGGLVIAVTFYAARGELFFEDIDAHLNLYYAISFITASYFLGHILQFAGRIRLIVDVHPYEVEGYKNYIEMIIALNKRIGAEGMREYERIVFQKHIGSTIGPACMACSLILFFSHYLKLNTINITGWMISFFLSFLVCLKLNHDMFELQNKILKDFLEKKKDEI